MPAVKKGGIYCFVKTVSRQQNALVKDSFLTDDSRPDTINLAELAKLAKFISE
jgi:hypothetical protein